MRFKLVNDLYERFSTPKSRLRHYYDHGLEEYPGLNEYEYEELAEELASKPVDNKRIFGFETQKLNGENALRARYIKYDVEGAEKQAIAGSQKMICSSMPDLLISLYHRNEDMFALPLQIHAMAPDYKLYLRRFRYIPAWDLNLYCISK